VYAWKPGSSELYFLNEEISDDQPSTYLWSYDLLNAEFQQKKIDELPEGALIMDIKFSPQGSQWIAGIRESAFLPSQVLWVMDVEDDLRISVIGDNSKIYSNVQWNAAGDKIVFQNFQLDTEQPGTAVILWDLNTNQQEVFLADAWFPRFK
jgi:dipeptidyl aminopeptidase/acylaminoacyl peptidase